MITSQIKPRRWRRSRLFWTRQRTVAVFSYRYDAHLVADLITNIDPVVDGWIAYDDRGGDRRVQQRAAAAADLARRSA
ncbi:hypothetical protein [Mesorhizobium sp. C268A]|uniref:hypothetical protein n=1 Tax=Mesorhizobium sp. C268A TaxID=2956826 RepID=UPI003334FD4E